MSLEVISTPSRHGPISTPAVEVINTLPSLRRLKPRQRKFIAEYCSDPSSLASACKRAGYHRLAYRDLFKNPVILQALREEVARLAAEHRNSSDVIIDLQTIAKSDAPAMARVRALEAELDIRGERQTRQVQPPESPAAMVSATFIGSVPALASASATIAALNEYRPDEEDEAK